MSRPPRLSSRKSRTSPVRTTGADSGAWAPPGRYSTRAPCLSRLPGLTRHSHTWPITSTSSRRRRRSVSATPPVPRLRPTRRAGITRVLLATTRSPGSRVAHDVPEDAMLDGAVLPVEHEEAAGIAGLRGSLRDELVGKLIVEVIGEHGASLVWFSQPPIIARESRRLHKRTQPLRLPRPRRLAGVARLMALDGGLGGGEPASAVVLAIHPQVARKARGVGVA